MGALMLQSGVTDLPDPGPKWNPAKPNPKDLPRYYLNEMAKKAYGIALKSSKNPEDAGDAMMDVVVDFLSKSTLKAMPAKSAISYVLKAVDWKAGALRKKNKGDRSTTIDDDGEETTLDLVDDAFTSNPYWNENPRQFRELAEAFPEDVWDRAVVPALKREHPDMPLFFELLGDGYNAKEIIEEGMLPHFDAAEYKTPVQTWNAKVQKIKMVLRDIAQRADNLDG
jgi:hypothetical protein